MEYVSVIQRPEQSIYPDTVKTATRKRNLPKNAVIRYL